MSESGWFAARPSGTEDVYKIYAESFRGFDHLRQIQDEARAIVAGALLTVSGLLAAWLRHTPALVPGRRLRCVTFRVQVGCNAARCYLNGTESIPSG